MDVTAAERCLRLCASSVLYRQKNDALLLFASKILPVYCGHVSHRFTYVRFKSFSQAGFQDFSWSETKTHSNT